MLDKSFPSRVVIVGATSLLVAAVGFGAVFLPPFPTPGWFTAAFTVAPVEHLWYSLPDSQRHKWLYDVGVTVATAVYPTLLAVAFWLWTKPLRRGVTIPWLRSALLIGLAVVASLVWYILGWHWGSVYQGRPTVIAYLLISTLWIGLATAWIRFSTTYASWWTNLAAHFLFFTWVVTFAFPWLGEMP